jgi:hypothetical protein
MYMPQVLRTVSDEAGDPKLLLNYEREWQCKPAAVLFTQAYYTDTLLRTLRRGVSIDGHTREPLATYPDMRG